MGQVPSIEARRAAIAAAHPAWRRITLDARLAEIGTRHPDRPLVLTDAATLTYRNVLDRAEALARGLRGLGVVAGDRVALVMANHAEFVPLVFATWRLGATAVPVNYLLRTDEFAYVIRQCACRVVITMASFRGMDYLAAFDHLVPGWDEGRFDGFPALSAVVAFGPARPGVHTLADLAARGRASHEPLAPSPARAEDPAILIYKSGGELVAPKEIEELLHAHPAVGQAFVVGLPDERWGEIGCAWIVPAPAASTSEGEIIAYCRERLARFKVPKRVLFLDASELPTTATGKVQKFRLIEMARDRVRAAGQEGRLV